MGGTINNVNINDLVTRNTRQDLSTSWTFIGPVTVNRDIAVSGLVDGVDMRELGNKATLNDLKDVHIYADVVFERDIIVDTLQVKNDVNGKNLEDIFNDFLQFVSRNVYIIIFTIQQIELVCIGMHNYITTVIYFRMELIVISLE